MPLNVKDYTAYSNGDTIFVDGTKTVAKVLTTSSKPIPSNKPLNTTPVTVTEMKTGKSFDVYMGKQTYTGLYYGKLNLLGVQGLVYNGQNNRHERSWDYYLQKRGSNVVEPYSSRALINMVHDNKNALKAARASGIYSKIAIPSVLLFIGGLTTSIFIEGGPVKEIAGTAGLIAMPLWIISMPMANAKSNKAIKLYNKLK